MPVVDSPGHMHEGRRRAPSISITWLFLHCELEIYIKLSVNLQFYLCKFTVILQ